MTAPKLKPYTLKFPIEHDGRQIGEVSMRRPKVKDLRAMQAAGNDEFEQSVLMISLLTGLPAEAIDEIDPDDFTVLAEMVAGFFPKGPRRETGAA